MKKLVSNFVAVLDTAASVLLFLLMMFVTFEVGSRYVLGQPHGYFEEVTLMLVLYVAFLAIAGSHHISVGALYEFLPRRWKQYADVLNDAATCVVSALVTFYGAQYVNRRRLLGGASDTELALPLWLFDLSLVVGVAAMSLVYLYKTYEAIEKVRASPAPVKE